MKKAKLMLSLIGIAGTLSILLAFKTQFSLYFVYTGIKSSGSCTTKVNGRALSNTDNPLDVKVAASTSFTTSGCPDVYTFVVSDI